MTKSNSTKRALLASVLSLALCFTMLIGSTFAWFTDSATTGVNQIVAGTLDIELVDENGAPITEALKWKVSDDKAQADILWEPGCRYDLQEVYVRNNGNLAVAFNVKVDGIEASDAKLNEVLSWTVVLPDGALLLPGATSGAIDISAHMAESAGNNYMGATVDGVSVTVSATQVNHESDSYDKEYDNPDNLKIVYVTPASAQDAIDNAQDGDIITLAAGDYEQLTIGKTSRNIKNLTIIGDVAAEVKGIFVDTKTGGALTVDGLTVRNVNFVEKGLYFDCGSSAPFVNVSNLTMEGCTMVGTGTDVDTQNKVGNRLFDIGTGSPGSNRFTNIVIKNCTVENAVQGIQIGSLYGDNVISGNTITNVGHNAVALRSVQGGTTIVSDNIISDGGDRAFRSATIAAGVVVTFENNKITNTGDAGDGSNWKVNTNNGTVNFVGNTVDGAAWEG